jgi:aerobic carbon-monoxide dehydrogenase medium subunit
VKPVPFHLERPTTIEAATKLLAEDGVFGKAIAGGQSLGPMLNLRLAQPELLVDLTAIAELTEITETEDYVDLGACITHADIEDGRVPDRWQGLLHEVAGRIAYRAVRNRGTIGGSLGHADPAADWVSVFPLIDAAVKTRSPRGGRVIAAKNLMASSFATALDKDELIVSVGLPKLSDRMRWGYYKFSRKIGEFAHAIGAVLYDPATCVFRAVIGAIETAPILIPDASHVFRGGFGSDLAARLDETAVLAALDHRNVKDDYIRRLACVALRRAAEEASK